MTVLVDGQLAAHGRYVEVYIAATMHSFKLCSVILGFATPAAVEAGAGLHSYSDWRNCISWSVAL
jgi:hypothetical protein